MTRAGNEASRLATVESLVDEGTFAIEQSRFFTVDRIRVGDHFYSDKPPLLSCWLAFVYAALPFRFTPSYNAAVYAVTLLGVGVFSVLLAILFLARSWRFRLPVWAGVLGALGVVLTTWVLSYGTTVNNHTPAACLLFAALCLLDRAPEQRWPTALGAGLAVGTLFNVDLPTGIVFFVAGAAIYALHRGRTRTCLALYVAGFAALVAVMLALDRLAYGTVLPAAFVSGGKHFPGSVHSQGIGGQRSPLALPGYLFDVTLGVRGVFSHMPALLFAIPGAVLAFRRDRATTVATCCGVVVLMLFFGTRTGDYGGWAYGFRYLVPLIPVLFWYALLWLCARARSRGRVVVYAGLVVGLVTSAVGAYNPWPVVYEGAASAPDSVLRDVRSPFAANVLCLAFEHFPRAAGTRRLAQGLYGEPLARTYLALAFGNMRRHDLVAAVSRGGG